LEAHFPGWDVEFSSVTTDLTVNATFVSNAGSSGGSTPSTPPEQPTDTGVNILINGKTVTAATASTTQEGDKTITAIITLIFIRVISGTLRNNS
jgi:hypothetical protein